jgi:hypothetical protein
MRFSPAEIVARLEVMAIVIAKYNSGRLIQPASLLMVSIDHYLAGQSRLGISSRDFLLTSSAKAEQGFHAVITSLHLPEGYLESLALPTDTVIPRSDIE